MNQSTQEYSEIVLCSNCFNDRGLRLDAEQIGITQDLVCLNCNTATGKKLNRFLTESLAHRFFVWGTINRFKYGAAPLVQFNQHQKTSITSSAWLKKDIRLIERALKVGFFHYGPRFWMFGEIEPLKDLLKSNKCQKIIDRIVTEYPTQVLPPFQSFYRLRKNPKEPDQPSEYDSPPLSRSGKNRFDLEKIPVMYGSSDLQTCIHECRISVEDEIYVSTIFPKKDLRLLNLSVVLKEEEGVTEFESLDLSVHMVFLAGKHSYKISRKIASKALEIGFDGIIYPSYFSLIRSGHMPFETTYGISHRHVPELHKQEEAKMVPNIVLFGRPIEDGKVAVQSINKVIINRVEYGIHFGPVTY